MNNILKKYIKHATAFGPIDASIIKIEHRQVLKQLFDPKNKIYDILKRNPSIIIGRRGSGKTAYLHSVFIDQESSIVEELKTSKTFSEIVNMIEKNTSSYCNLSENIATFWEDIFYTAIISKVAMRYSNLDRSLSVIRDFAAKNYLQNTLSIDSFLWNIVHSVNEKFPNTIVGAVANFIESEVGINFDEAKDLVIKILNEKNINAIILLDSLEQYPTSIQ